MQKKEYVVPRICACNSQEICPEDDADAGFWEGRVAGFLLIAVLIFVALCISFFSWAIVFGFVYVLR